MNRIITQIREINGQIVKAVDAGLWRDALEFSQTRHLLIQEYVESSQYQLSEKEIRQLMSEIESADKSAILQISCVKKSMIDESLAVTRSHHATNQYHQIQRGTGHWK